MPIKALYDVAAPAKLNLFLHVIGKRPDGYHLLQSIFVLIDWFDTLHFESRDDGRLRRHDVGSPLPEDDLCVRAARALQEASRTPLGADITIEKNLPSGAGMGGGSSDAASTLLALNRLWSLHWPLERLQALGLALGADVPFFLGGSHAAVQGIGERLTPVSVPSQWFAVVKPSANLETRAIFASPLLGRSIEADIVEGLEAAYGRNDLQAAAEATCAEVGRAAALLQAVFGNSRMTGSGSAVYARAGGGEHPDRSMPSELEDGWTGRMCRSLTSHPLAGWAD
jgi:4-diphosphocytidyl-2-C-methyl-D-erythritol kinase